MTISYHWESLEVNVERDTGDVSPHTYKVVQDVYYDFEVEIKTKDVVDYLMPYHMFDRKVYKSELVREKKTANYYLTQAINYLVDSANCDLEELENDEDFVEFMKERYENKALQEWEESNDEY